MEYNCIIISPYREYTALCGIELCLTTQQAKTPFKADLLVAQPFCSWEAMLKISTVLLIKTTQKDVQVYSCVIKSKSSQLSVCQVKFVLILLNAQIVHFLLKGLQILLKLQTIDVSNELIGFAIAY